MKEFEKDIDQLFRKSLEDYKITPDKGSKEKFKAAGIEILELNKKGFTNWKLFGIIAFIIVSLLGIIFYSVTNKSLLYREKAELANSEKEALLKDNNSLDSDLNIDYVSEFEDAQNDNESIIKASSISLNTIKTNKKTKNDDIANTSNKQSFSQPKIANKSDLYASHKSSDLFRTISALKPFSVQIVSSIDKGDIRWPIMNPSIIPDTLNVDIENRSKKPSENYAKLDVAYSLYYSPQYIFNIIENSKLVNNFGIDINFKLFNNKYIIRSGAGVSVSKGYYEFAIDYNEYLGSYQGLDSISFAWDDKHHYLLPTYYKSEREVFDTAIQTTISNVYKRFTYLQFPFVLGYNFISKEKFSLGLKFGPTLSLLLTSKTLSEDYDPEQNQVLQINQITPNRISTNWLLMAGLNMSINTSQNLFFEIEPQFTYYFNSVYEKNDISKPPIGIGCRLAIGIK